MGKAPSTPQGEGAGQGSQAELQQLTEEVLRGRTLIVASNRGPVSLQITPEGELEGERGSGGVITALSAISNYANPIWVAAAMTEGDRRQAEQAGGQSLQWSTPEHRFRLRFVVVPQQAYDWYYNTIANPLLWFLQHNMWDAPRTPAIDAETWRAWHDGYEVVNRAFAEQIIDELAAAGRPLVMLHDYHLYRCAAYLRPHLPEGAILHHFIHIPCPGPDYWRMLPAAMRDAVFRGLCANDVVGLQTHDAGLNFLRCCENFLPDADIDYRLGRIALDGRMTWVRHYPISIDTGDLRHLAQSEEVRQRRGALQRHLGEQTIIRVDRVEPSKNIVRGFQAFEMLLQQHPEYLGRLKFLVFLVPSRLGIEEYRDYLREISGAAMWINAEYGTKGWEPVVLFVGENYERAVAAMQLYDVMLVNPIADGMNLVSKEGPTVNERHGVLVLSEGAGSFEQLRDHAITVSPYDLVGTADALHEALRMDEPERRRRNEQMARHVAEQDLTLWLAQQLRDIGRIAAGEALA